MGFMTRTALSQVFCRQRFTLEGSLQEAEVTSASDNGAAASGKKAALFMLNTASREKIFVNACFSGVYLL
ncbi:MAG: hypothetical protein MJ177_04150 [Clostridia bacterium]|nr:hypothetical protein [Clostridia bacterium]